MTYNYEANVNGKNPPRNMNEPMRSKGSRNAGPVLVPKGWQDSGLPHNLYWITYNLPWHDGLCLIIAA